jgi:hypothetical protein
MISTRQVISEPGSPEKDMAIRNCPRGGFLTGGWPARPAYLLSLAQALRFVCRPACPQRGLRGELIVSEAILEDLHTRAQCNPPQGQHVRYQVEAAWSGARSGAHVCPVVPCVTIDASRSGTPQALALVPISAFVSIIFSYMARLATVTLRSGPFTIVWRLAAWRGALVCWFRDGGGEFWDPAGGREQGGVAGQGGPGAVEVGS